MSLTDRLFDFFIARTDPRPLGFARWVLGVALVLSAVEQGYWLGVWLFAPNAPRIPYAIALPALPTVLYLPFTVLLFTAACAFTAGWHTRVAGVTTCLFTGYLLLVDQQFYGNDLYLVFVLCLLFTISDTGASLSVDACRGGRRDSVARWPVVLVKLLLTIVYVFAIVAKLNWPDVAGLHLASGGFLRDSLIPFPDAWRTPAWLAVYARAILVFETALVTALWVPRYRPWALTAGFLLHAGIPFAMPAAFVSLMAFSTIGVAMLAPYVLFLDAAPASRIVVWDDQCTFCRWWITWFRRLDWLGVHQFVGPGDPHMVPRLGITREAADEALQLVALGKRAAGFAAVQQIMEALPLTFLWSPILRLPPLHWGGDRLYRAVAERRRCRVVPLPAHQQGRAAATDFA